MRDLDDTDLEILQLLVEDGRRPFSDIAERVGLSAPAVSDRVERLQELGVIDRFTVDIDRSQLRSGIPVMITFDGDNGGLGAAELNEILLETGAVEHTFRTAEADILAFARVPDNDIATWISEVLPEDVIADFEVELLARADWSPDLGETEFALTCAQCGNTVDSEGTATRIDGQVHQFCCPSCKSRFIEKYERLQENGA